MATRQVILKFRSGASDFSVDSAVLDSLDWGNGIEDSVRFDSVDGRIVQFGWAGILFVRESDVPPSPTAPPPTPVPLPNWLVHVHFTEQSGASNFEVTEAMKNQMLADLAGSGSGGYNLTFDTLQGYRLRFPSKALSEISFILQP